MKNVILFLILSCSTFHSLSAQNIAFPDLNFKQALLDEGVDTGNDGEISQAEALAITSLDVSGRGITDLTGIENFTNLQTLHCEYNSLTSLDVSGLTSLESLYCHNNSLTSLDVSGLANLGYLFCDNNSLTSLDVSGLTSLRLLHCYNNPLTTIDIRSKPELEYFNAKDISELACIIVDDVNDLPDNRSVDQGDGIFTTEPCVVSFEGFEGLCALVQSSGLPSIKEAALLATLKVAEASCTAGKKWMAVTSLITFDAMVARLQQLGRLSANEADQILEVSGRYAGERVGDLIERFEIDPQKQERHDGRNDERQKHREVAVKAAREEEEEDRRHPAQRHREGQLRRGSHGRFGPEVSQRTDARSRTRGVSNSTTTPPGAHRAPTANSRTRSSTSDSSFVDSSSGGHNSSPTTESTSIATSSDATCNTRKRALSVRGAGVSARNRAMSTTVTIVWRRTPTPRT